MPKNFKEGPIKNDPNKKMAQLENRAIHEGNSIKKRMKRHIILLFRQKLGRQQSLKRTLAQSACHLEHNKAGGYGEEKAH